VSQVDVLEQIKTGKILRLDEIKKTEKNLKQKNSLNSPSSQKKMSRLD